MERADSSPFAEALRPVQSSFVNRGCAHPSQAIEEYVVRPGDVQAHDDDVEVAF